MFSFLICLKFKKQILTILRRTQFVPYLFLFIFCFLGPNAEAYCENKIGFNYYNCVMEASGCDPAGGMSDRKACATILREASIVQRNTDIFFNNCSGHHLRPTGSKCRELRDEIDRLKDQINSSVEGIIESNRRGRGRFVELSQEEDSNYDFNAHLDARGDNNDPMVHKRQECTRSCQEHVNKTTKNCTRMDSKQCQQVCNSCVNTNSDASCFVSNLNGRASCLTEVEDKYIRSFTAKCLRKIKETEENKGQSALLLCDGNASRNDSKCEKFCEQEAQKSYGNPTTTEEDIKLATGGSFHPTRNSIVHQALTTSDMDSFVGLKINTNIGTLVANVNNLQDPLSWAKCKLGDCEPHEYSLKTTLTQAVEKCHELETEALECCQNPESCAGGGLMQAVEAMSRAYTSVNSVRGRKSYCKAVRNAHGLYTAMQGTMAGSCSHKSNKCRQECGQLLKNVSKVFEEACGVSLGKSAPPYGTNMLCEEEFFDHYSAKYYKGQNTKGRVLADVPRDCQIAGRHAGTHVEDMIGNAGTAIIAGQKSCGENGYLADRNGDSPPPPGGLHVGGGGDEEEEDPPPGGGNTIEIGGPPPAAPEIGSGGGNSEDDGGNGYVNGSKPRTPSNPFDIEPPDLGPSDEENAGQSAPMGGLANSGGGGGGGGIGGGGGPGGSGGYPSENSQPSKQKNIIQRLAHNKLKGYGGNPSPSSNPREPFPKTEQPERKLAELDLKKILPKGKQLSKVGSIGSPHEDIFQKVSTRIRWMCRTDKISCK